VKIYATYNIKGGVGKTAAAVNLAYLSAADGCRTLLRDLDPQGAARQRDRERRATALASEGANVLSSVPTRGSPLLVSRAAAWSVNPVTLRRLVTWAVTLSVRAFWIAQGILDRRIVDQRLDVSDIAAGVGDLISAPDSNH